MVLLPDITREQQQDKVADATGSFLESLGTE